MYELIDIHAHLLPGVDDGSRTLEESCMLIKQARKNGVKAVVTTPHYSRRCGVKDFSKAFDILQKAIPSDFKIYLGQETFYHEGLIDNLKAGKALTMAGSRYVLVEFHIGISFRMMNRGIRQLLAAGFVPIIAHMERYRCLREKKNLDNISRSGCLMQMNYESLKGHWFSYETHWCRKQVLEGRIHFLGTDMHRTDYRPPEISEAIKWLEKSVTHNRMSEALLRNMLYRNAERMLCNEVIE